MIKLKSILIEIKSNHLYHVTKKSNLSKIKKEGIIPQKPSDIDLGDTPCIFLFKNKIEMEDAVMNWLGDMFDEDEELVCLTIDSKGINIQPSNVKYEIVTYDIIPFSKIIKIENL